MNRGLAVAEAYWVSSPGTPLEANVPSTRVARSPGFRRFGSTLAVRLAASPG